MDAPRRVKKGRNYNSKLIPPQQPSDNCFPVAALHVNDEQNIEVPLTDPDLVLMLEEALTLYIESCRDIPGDKRKKADDLLILLHSRASDISLRLK